MTGEDFLRDAAGSPRQTGKDPHYSHQWAETVLPVAFPHCGKPGPEGVHFPQWEPSIMDVTPEAEHGAEAVEREAEDYDGPLKDAVDTFFRGCLVVCFPPMAALVDWSQPVVSRTTELRQFGGHALRGPDHVDLLFEVSLLDDPARRYVHIEIQAQRQPAEVFPQRVRRYNCLIAVHLDTEPFDLALLADPSEDWRPDSFTYAEGEQEVHLRFGMVKLLDWRGQEAELEGSAEPFAEVILAHLETLLTHQQPERRFHVKVARTQGLYDGRFDVTTVRDLFRITNWQLTLPEEWERRFWTEMQAWEETRKMSYVMPIVRWAREEGLEQGLERGLERGLEQGRREELQRLIREILRRRFGSAAEVWSPAVAGIEDAVRLRELETRAWEATSAEEFGHALNGHATPH